MRISVIALIAGLVAVSLPCLGAQSLADAARKEEERRKSVKGSGKVFTNSDLKAAPQPAPSATDPAAPAPSDSASSLDVDQTTGSSKASSRTAAAATDKKADSKPDEKDEPYWHGRMKVLQERLEQDRTLAEALQSRVNALTADFVNRDDPAQRAVIEINRQKALAELDRMQKAVTSGAKAVADLEEEARRAGVPPGWLR